MYLLIRKSLFNCSQDNARCPVKGPGIIPSTSVYHRFYLEDWVLWLLFILASDTQSAPMVAQERLYKLGDSKPARLLDNALPE